MALWKQTSLEFEKFTQQRLGCQAIDGINIALGGESVKCCDAFKYLGVILDSSLSLNQLAIDMRICA